MSDNDRPIDLFMARHAPSKVFATPMDLANEKSITAVQKLELLELWEGRIKRQNEIEPVLSQDDEAGALRAVRKAIEHVENTLK